MPSFTAIIFSIVLDGGWSWIVIIPNDRPRRPCSFSPFNVSMPVANIINAVGNIYDSKFLTKYLNRLAENTHYVENLGKQYEFILNKQKYSKNKLG